MGQTLTLGITPTKTATKNIKINFDPKVKRRSTFDDLMSDKLSRNYVP